jgi:hypothetical protein
MNNTLNIMGGLIIGSILFLITINYMAENIEDFESRPLPTPKQMSIISHNPLIKVDATSRKEWTLVDFSTKKTYKAKNIEKEKNKANYRPWDIGFQRTKIVTNGGKTNPRGRVSLKNLGPVDFDSMTSIPIDGYTQDENSYGKILNKAIVDWYLYRTRTHNIESQKNVYVVKMAEGGYMKMRILNYYCVREESECKSIMCSRQDAACYSIEYILSHDQKNFPSIVAKANSSPSSLKEIIN